MEILYEGLRFVQILLRLFDDALFPTPRLKEGTILRLFFASINDWYIGARFALTNLFCVSISIRSIDSGSIGIWGRDGYFICSMFRLILFLKKVLNSISA